MKLRIGLTLCLAVLAAFPASSLRADGLIRDGVGPISTGRGGTNQAFSDNSAVILDNPAGMMNVSGGGLGELGVEVAMTDVHYEDPFNNVDSKTRPIPMGVLGYIQKSDDERWAWGIGCFAPAGFGASYGAMDNPVTGNNVVNKSIGAMGKLLPALSYQATDRLSVGISVGIAFSHVQLDGPFYLQSGSLAGTPAILDLQGTGFAPTGSLGFQYQLFDDLMIGASYTEQTTFDLRGPTTAVLAPGFLDIESRFEGKYRMKWPRSAAFGLKYDLCAHRRFGADVIWYDWSGAFTQMDIQLSDPSNPIIGVLAPLPLKDAFPMNWRDSVSMRLGYEVDTTDFNTWRFGYVYHSSPVPDSTLNPYVDGILQHAFSLGFSHKFTRATANVAYQYNFGETRHVTTSSLVGGQFNDSTMNAQAHFFMGSFTFPF